MPCNDRRYNARMVQTQPVNTKMVRGRKAKVLCVGSFNDPSPRFTRGAPCSGSERVKVGFPCTFGWRLIRLGMRECLHVRMSKDCEWAISDRFVRLRASRAPMSLASSGRGLWLDIGGRWDH